MAEHVLLGRSIKLDNSAGSLTELNAHLNNIEVVINAETSETRNFDSTSVGTLRGQYSWDVNVSGYQNSTTDALFGVAWDGTSVYKTVSVQTPQGDHYYTGEALPNGAYSPVSGSPDGGAGVFSASLRGNGNLTRTSVAPS